MDRMQFEEKTVYAMICLYCRKHHQPTETLCPECRELWTYVEQRLAKCPFRSDKPTCEQCPVHCYKPAMREKIRQVMRFAGPRMPLYHPMMAVRHLVFSFLKKRVINGK